MVNWIRKEGLAVTMFVNYINADEASLICTGDSACGTVAGGDDIDLIAGAGGVTLSRLKRPYSIILKALCQTFVRSDGMDSSVLESKPIPGWFLDPEHSTN